jgi:hypothetical protein
MINVIARKFKYVQRNLRDISKLVVDTKVNSYSPHSERKGKWAIRKDILMWFARHREVNRYYYLYNFDKKNNGVENQMISYKTFRSMRDNANLRLKDSNFNYASLLRDKFIFGQLLKSLHFRTPKNIALITNDELTWLDTMKTVPLSSLTQNPYLTIDGFCKKLTGLQGAGAFPLKLSGGKIYSAGTELSTDELQQKITGQYLLQERISQHEALSNLHPQSVNTMRILTFNNKGKIELFSAALRIGTKSHNVDNWAAGGIAVGIDIETGKLRKEGLYKPGYGGFAEVHPDSGITLLDYQIPFFKESIEVVCQLHRYLYGIHSIGWDIAITPEGPVFIEANEDWDGSFTMSLEKNFKSRFLKMYPK